MVFAAKENRQQGTEQTNAPTGRVFQPLATSHEPSFEAAKNVAAAGINTAEIFADVFRAHEPALRKMVRSFDSFAGQLTESQIFKTASAAFGEIIGKAVAEYQRQARFAAIIGDRSSASAGMSRDIQGSDLRGNLDVELKLRKEGESQGRSLIARLLSEGQTEQFA